jgi:sarcosine oxidase, subunit gamma
MSEYRVTRRSALDSKPLRSDSISISALPEGHVIQILGKDGGPDLRSFLSEKIGDGAKFAVRIAAPFQWFVVGDRALSPGETATMLEALHPHAAGVDQSHGRIRLRVEGSTVERLLAKGTGTDVSLEAFPVGYSTTTLIGHIAAHVTRVGEHAFEIMVLRGFAESLWDDFARMAQEFT